jgi:hypothetical protein
MKSFISNYWKRLLPRVSPYRFPLSFLVMGNVRRFGRLECIYMPRSFQQIVQSPGDGCAGGLKTIPFLIAPSTLIAFSATPTRRRLLRRDESHDLPSQAAPAHNNRKRNRINKMFPVRYFRPFVTQFIRFFFVGQLHYFRLLRCLLPRWKSGERSSTRNTTGNPLDTIPFELFL